MKRSTLIAWLSALRSSDYEQGRCVLRTRENRYCCLGVLCDITDSTRWKEPESYDIAYRWADSYSTLPEILVEFHGFANSVGGAMNRFAGYSLVSMNDDGVPFTEIADKLEADPSQFGLSIEED